MNRILCLVLLLITIQCQEDTTIDTTSASTIAGIGVGTFIIIIAIIFSLIWCLACRSSSRPQIYSALGLIVPVLLIVIFIAIPKQAERVPTSEDTDINFVMHVIFMVLAILGFVLAAVLILIDFMFVGKKAKNIARSAFIVKEEEQQTMTLNKSRVLSRSQSQGNIRAHSRQSGI